MIFRRTTPLTKSSCNILLLFKLKYAAILLLSFIVDCESAMLQWLILFTWIHKSDWLKKKATFARSGKVEMISTFQWHWHFRKASVNKTFTHVQEEKRAMSPRHSTCIPSSVKSPLWWKFSISRKYLWNRESGRLLLKLGTSRSNREVWNVR